MADRGIPHAIDRGRLKSTLEKARLRVALAGAKSDFECQNSDFEPQKNPLPPADSYVLSIG